MPTATRPGRTSTPFDLSPLPEGFRRQVERAYLRPGSRRPSVHPLDPVSMTGKDDPLVGLAYAIGDAWRGSTARQRAAAEPGVNAVLEAVFSRCHAGTRAYMVGVLGSRCRDLSLRFLDEQALDGVDVLDGAWGTGDWAVSIQVRDILDALIESLPRGRWAIPVHKG